MKRAASLAEQVLDEYSNKISELTLIPSGGGVFEVTFGGDLIYSKKETGTFPEPDQVMQKVGSA